MNKFLLKGPLMAQIELTEQCNHSCRHCYNHWREDGGELSFSVEGIREVIDKLAQMEILAISFTGGEPLLNKETLFAGIDAATENDILVTVNTNASFLDTETLDYFLTKNVHLLISVLSFDEQQFNKMTGVENFKEIMANISNAVKWSADMAINMVVNDCNVAEITKTADFVVNELGCSNFRVTPVSPPKYLALDSPYSLNLENYDKYFDAIMTLHENGVSVGTLGAIPFCLVPEKCYEVFSSFIGCTAGRNIITVGADGGIRPCSQADFSTANIFDLSGELLFKACKEDLSEWYDGTFVPEECKECAELNRCYGGCRMHAYNISDCMSAKDPRMLSPLKQKINFQDYCDQGSNDEYFSRFQDGSGISKFQILPMVRFREELDGYVTLFSGDYYDLVNDSAFNLFKMLFVESSPVLLDSMSTELKDIIIYFHRRGYVEKI